MRYLSVNVRINRPQFNLNLNTKILLSGVTAIFGHSGSGKTSLLRCIAGLEKHSQSSIQFGQTYWQNKHTFLPTHKRQIGYVFQEPSLLAHLTVRDNLNYAIKRAGKNRHISESQVVELLKLTPLLAQFPATLSGGEKQRVAIGRALLAQPQLLLMDEPLASLDLKHKYEILTYLEQLKQQLNIPIIYISHSPEEVARLADQLIMLEKGQIISHQSIEQSFDLLNQANRQLNEQAVFLSAELIETAQQWQQMKVALKSAGKKSTTYLWLSQINVQPEQELRLKIMAKDVSISLQQAQGSSIQNILPVVIEKIETLDSGMQLITLNAGEHLLYAKISNKAVHDLKLYAGMPVYAQIKAAALI
ncbi:molybdenum ABC transporter ATP-binding protein [Catenovulum sp. 2E275]|uniref:molybdenum ABC transporter ATP-binding protein n=1 Tax=Catenovulum sp. 2E275 TaxID=2980497 RepID=UPI0021D303B4|nr:molybdenum ABC transporter ATP-binding protein [Catenovulum sp. 2E275]MCU4675084.1 molybdenum ABC transporter ATP-binding protein [Catenovulum sp. 2E275]